ncbi:RidA family protein [Burkholderia multivorans]|uniref:RidA family protein n=1 Tax=Burkholderia multivorans TaxID=87883 RepID=UPI0021C225AC|nr:RidA family protein [Burkholderia multivorans]MCA8335074.1 RidA family protein [Burkholderia multivorans]UXZ59676.1 RidA family protein [Burkholderia multivorans]
MFLRRKTVAPPRALALASAASTVRTSNSSMLWSASKPKPLTLTGGVGDVLNVLAQIRRHLGGFDWMHPIVRVEGHVALAHGFFGQPAVVDGASDMFTAVLGDKAGDARSAFSQRELPPDATVIPVVIAEIRHT